MTLSSNKGLDPSLLYGTTTGSNPLTPFPVVKCHGGNMENKVSKPIRTSTALSVAVAVSVLVFAPCVYAADSLGPSLCAVLKELIPEVKTYQPAGAKAQLVMALAEKYETDQLHQV